MKKKAFTLAEVLITLTIIGVIAALTIPNLMQKWSDHADVAKVKDAYSILDNAIKIAIKEKGTIDEWFEAGASKNDNGAVIARTLKEYLKVSKFCDNLNSNCFSNKLIGVYTLDGVGISGYGYYGGQIFVAAVILDNGYLLGIPGFDSFSTMPSIWVDINGKKKPNRLGYDMFPFFYDQNGLIYGNAGIRTRQDFCNIFHHSNSWMNGMSCAYYVRRHGNMDYKYRDVSAEW